MHALRVRGVMWCFDFSANRCDTENYPMNLKVSIITPTFNSMKFLGVTYRSLLAQTWQDWEWLVTDDCSEDESYEYLTAIAREDDRVKPYRNSVNSGAAVTRNNSIARASGEFLVFIDSDDYWEPNKLERQLRFMGEDIDFSFTGYAVMDERGVLTGKLVDVNRMGSFGYEDMLCKAATLGCSTVMLRRSAFADLSMPLIRTGQDYALWLKLLKTGKRAHLIGEPLTRYRITPNSISRNKVKKAKRQWQIYREIEGLALPKAAYCFAFYAWRAVFRR